MMRKRLAASFGQIRRLRPHVIQWLVVPGVPAHMRRWRFTDDDWFVIAPPKDDILKLSNQRTSHQIDLPFDNIREYLSNVAGPGYLILKSQIFMDGPNLWSEPLARPFGTGLYTPRAPSRRVSMTVRTLR